MNKINFFFVGTILLDITKRDLYNAVLKFRIKKVAIFGELAYLSFFLCQPGEKKGNNRKARWNICFLSFA